MYYTQTSDISNVKTSKSNSKHIFQCKLSGRYIWMVGSGDGLQDTESSNGCRYYTEALDGGNLVDSTTRWEHRGSVAKKEFVVKCVGK